MTNWRLGITASLLLTGAGAFGCSAAGSSASQSETKLRNQWYGASDGEWYSSAVTGSDGSGVPQVGGRGIAWGKTTLGNNVVQPHFLIAGEGEIAVRQFFEFVDDGTGNMVCPIPEAFARPGFPRPAQVNYDPKRQDTINFEIGQVSRTADKHNFVEQWEEFAANLEDAIWNSKLRTSYANEFEHDISGNGYGAGSEVCFNRFNREGNYNHVTDKTNPEKGCMIQWAIRVGDADKLASRALPHTENPFPAANAEEMRISTLLENSEDPYSDAAIAPYIFPEGSKSYDLINGVEIPNEEIPNGSYPTVAVPLFTPVAATDSGDAPEKLKLRGVAIAEQYVRATIPRRCTSSGDNSPEIRKDVPDHVFRKPILVE